MPWKISDVDRHKKGLSKKQKEQWVATANATRASCLKDGGTEAECDAKAVRVANGTVANSLPNDTSSPSLQYVSFITNAAQVRTEIYEGRAYLVAPVVAFREGVWNNERVTTETISRFIEAWNGIPLVISHPTENDIPISANDRSILATQGVGRFWNATFEDGKLKGELWVDILKAQSLGGDAVVALDKLQTGGQLEVSTGYFREPVFTSGVYQDKPYDIIAQHLQPDHLALLPNEKGACSWEDGCGAPRVHVEDTAVVRINAHECPTCKGAPPTMTEKFKATWAKIARAFGVNIEMSHEEIGRTLSEALHAEEQLGQNEWCFVENVYDDAVVYTKRIEDQPGEMYRRSYTIDTNGKATFGEAELVVREVRYLPITEETPATNQQPQPPDEGDALSPEKGEVSMDKKAMVTALIANTATAFEEVDREWLERQSEEKLQKLAPKEEIKTHQQDPGDPDPHPVPPSEPKPEPVPPSKPESAPPQAAATQPAMNTKQEPEDALGDIKNPELRAHFAKILAQDKQHKADLVRTLMANTKCKYGKEKLEAMSAEDLEALHEMLTPEDYTGRGGPRVHTAEQKFEWEPAPGDPGFQWKQ